MKEVKYRAERRSNYNKVVPQFKWRVVVINKEPLLPSQTPKSIALIDTKEHANLFVSALQLT